MRLRINKRTACIIRAFHFQRKPITQWTPSSCRSESPVIILWFHHGSIWIACYIFNCYKQISEGPWTLNDKTLTVVTTRLFSLPRISLTLLNILFLYVNNHISFANEFENVTKRVRRVISNPLVMFKGYVRVNLTRAFLFFYDGKNVGFSFISICTLCCHVFPGMKCNTSCPLG